MIKTKKQMYTVIGAFILVMLLTTVTYAFFNYTRTGVANNIRTGRIYFNSTQNGTLNLTNLFPVASNEVGNNNKIEVRVYGDTTYAGGEEFEITLVSVNNTIVSGSTEKTIPVNYIASYAATPVATGETPNNIGTSSNDYFNARGSSTAVYQLKSAGVVTEGEQVLIGYIPKDVAVDGTLTIKAYLDRSSIAITDTYDESSPETDNMGTTTEWVAGRTVLTTDEWNSLTNTPISFKIKTEANEGVWVKQAPICKRATQLHVEKCTNTDATGFCQSDGYALDADIIYGNLGTSGNMPQTGDAFDCNVDGTGYNERFYYVSNYYDTASKTFDNTTATLIYHSNTIDGSSSLSGSPYAMYPDSSGNWNGPAVAITNLPNTTQWGNVELKTSSRTILACDNADCSNTPVLTTNNGNKTITPNPFDYTGYTARLLTVMEVKQAGCDTLSEKNSLGTNGSIKACNFLLEGTAYSNSSNPSAGIWLENPHASDTWAVWSIRATYSRVYDGTYYSAEYGVRPTIDVSYSRIEY